MRSCAGWSVVFVGLTAGLGLGAALSEQSGTSGALVGGFAGTAVAASGEEHLRLPAETRLQFTLTMKVVINP